MKKSDRVCVRVCAQRVFGVYWTVNYLQLPRKTASALTIGKILKRRERRNASATGWDPIRKSISPEPGASKCIVCFESDRVYERYMRGRDEKREREDVRE